MKPYIRKHDASQRGRMNNAGGDLPKMPSPLKPGSGRQGPPGHNGFDKTIPLPGPKGGGLPDAIPGKKPPMPGGMPGPITAPGMKPPSSPPGAGKPNPWKPGPKPPGFGMPKPKNPFKDRKWKYGYQAALFGDKSFDPRTHKNWRRKMPRWMRKAVQKGGADWRSHLDDRGRGYAKDLRNNIMRRVSENQRARLGIRPRPPVGGMRPTMPRPRRRPRRRFRYRGRFNPRLG